ncbi:MAG: hypothetical protein GXO83_00365 [Chlorobi bacterium]|nr:hypothetical protein [Chlorobiota bacterium]
MKKIIITTGMAIFLMAGGMAWAQNSREQSQKMNGHHIISSALMQKDTLKNCQHMMMQSDTKMMQHDQNNGTQEGMMQNQQEMQSMMKDHMQMCMNMMKMHQQKGDQKNMMTGQQPDNNMQSMMTKNMQNCMQMMNMNGKNAGNMHNTDTTDRPANQEMNRHSKMQQMELKKVKSRTRDDASMIRDENEVPVREPSPLRVKPIKGQVLVMGPENQLRFSPETIIKQ